MLDQSMTSRGAATVHWFAECLVPPTSSSRFRKPVAEATPRRVSSVPAAQAVMGCEDSASAVAGLEWMRVNVGGSGSAGAAQAEALELLNAFLGTQALHVVAVLGVADLLAEREMTAEELASVTGTHAPSLYRLLRMLTGARVFRLKPDGRFSLGDLGHALRSDTEESVRDWALYVGAREPWEAWGRLLDAVTTGDAGFELAHGMPTYAYLARHPELAAPFDRWMTRQSEQHNHAVVAAFDFSAFEVVADIGGGQGSTLAAILQAHPALRGILMDRPEVTAQAPQLLEAAGISSRCTIAAGDMLAGVPRGADLYFMKRVLMIWGDEEAIQVLAHCAASLPEGGKVVAAEILMPDGNAPSPAKSFDLLMLLANRGGRIRSEEEFRDLFAAAGLRLTNVIPTASPNTLLECALA